MSANDDLIERIARLIYDADALRPRLTWERLTPLTQGEYRKEARAALSAFPLAEASRLDELERENARMRDVLKRISQWKPKSAILESECELMQSIARAALAGSGEK